jgi:hypothetical protein
MWLYKAQYEQKDKRNWFNQWLLDEKRLLFEITI